MSEAARPEPGSLEYQLFKRRFRELAGFDLDHYKSEQMERRTRQCMARRGVPSLAMFLRQLERDPVARREYLDYLAINTSQFFRDTGVFESLRTRILPDLIRAHGRLRIWSAGCSIGAEPYTVAIILDELGQGGRHFIVASDIDQDALDRARLGEYHELHFVSTEPSVRARYFTRLAANSWRISPEIGRQVEFRRHDLLRDPHPSGFHLVLCRYVMIYLTGPAQQLLVERLTAALAPGGVLVVGGPEQVVRPETFGLERLEHSIYRRPG